MGVRKDWGSDQWLAYAMIKTRSGASRFKPLGYFETEEEAVAETERFEAVRYATAVRKWAKKNGVKLSW